MADLDDRDLTMARRHVAEAKVRIAAQRRLVTRLETAGRPSELAQQLLVSLEETMTQMQIHCDYLERAHRGA